MYSLSTSFWIVPVSLSGRTPCSSPTVWYISSSTAAGALIVIDVDTVSRGMPAEERPHVVDGVDGHADLAHLAVRDPGIGVVSHLGGQVEGDREPGGARLDQLVIAAVGLLGSGEAGVLTHRPGPVDIHSRIHSASKRILSRLAKLFFGPEIRKLAVVIDGIDGKA